MLFKDIIGQDHIKTYLTQNVDQSRIPHAQLFVGPEGSGTLPMAIAYAQYLLCGNSNGENINGAPNCNTMVDALSHPDLHFVFPVTTTDKVKSKPTSRDYLEEWRKLVKEQPYGNLFDWYALFGVKNKQGQIGVNEALSITKTLSLKSYEGGYKVMIIWMAEKLNIAVANKLLKIIEEPPEKTVFILIAEDEEQLIETIKSRCQAIRFPPLSSSAIEKELIKRFSISEVDAKKIAYQSHGNYNKACDLVYKDSEDLQFETWFVFWVRTAFKAKGNKNTIHDLISWSETIAKTGRETQKQFLGFCLRFFRQALLLNYGAEKLVYFLPKTKGFDLKNFAPFIHENNIEPIADEIQKAIYHIERNGNSKLIITDLSIKLTRLLHSKPT